MSAAPQSRGTPFRRSRKTFSSERMAARCSLPFIPSAGTPAGNGAAVVCPGGNYGFLHPREGPPVARFLAESLGIPTFVLRYRLLPAHGLDAMQEDLQRAVRLAREKCGGGPVLAIGFSAGGHLVSSGSAASVAAGRDMGRPDCQALVCRAPIRTAI